MARPCTVCLHPELAALDALLTERHSAASVAAGFGLGPDAVERHARGHLARRRSTVGVDPAAHGRFPDVVKSPVDGKIGDVGADPLAELVAALRVRALAGDTGATREYRLVLAAQAAAQRASAPAIDLSTTPEWTSLRSVILEALEPFPEARIAVADALKDE